MDLDDVDHEPYIERTIDLAAEAAERGDRPCGSLLVADGTVLRTDTNRVNSGDDVALHPELSLARWAARELGADGRAGTALYTTVEPCSMCASGLAFGGIGAVVFCVSGGRYWDVASAAGATVPDSHIPCAEVFDRLGAAIPTAGPIREDRGVEVVRHAYDD